MFQKIFAGKKVWLSGGTGFKGSWLAEWLYLMGAKVSIFSLPPPTDPALFYQLGLTSRVDWQQGDIRDAAAVSKSLLDCQPDFVFHLAAQPLVRLSYTEPVETYQTNVLGTIHVLEALRQLENPCATVMVTTDKCYDNREWLHGYREDDPLGGHDPYSASKVGTEAVVAAWQQIQRTSGGPKVVAARAGNVIGGGDWGDSRLLPDLIRSFSSGQKMAVRNPASTRPWQHVLDPLSGYISALEAILNDEKITSINFGPDTKSIAVSEVVEVAVKTWGLSTNIELGSSVQNNAAEAVSLDLNPDYAKQSLGWEPCWSQEEAVISTVQWWNKVLNQGVKPVDACLDDLSQILSQK